MNVINNIRNAIRSFLKIDPASPYSISVTELMDFNTNAFINGLWYRGDSYELENALKQLPTTNYNFWSVTPTSGIEIRKIHTGLPKVIVNTLSNIVVNDMGDITISKEDKNTFWEDIATENEFIDLLNQVIKDVLVYGDGAFKISIDTDISQYPIIEFYEGYKVDYKYNRGRLSEVVFKSDFKEDNQLYYLYETYGYGYIRYKTYNESGNEVSISKFPHLADLVDVDFNDSFILAVPLMFYHSEKWDGRGQSIFDSKHDNFDALDEVWSDWMDASRNSRIKTYIPEDICPRDINTGEIKKPNTFDNRFILVKTAMQEKAQNKIDVHQPEIRHESYLSTYVTALDLCLQGIISPSTLGIDVKKLDNAEAQREKEKATLYTRNNIVEMLQKKLPVLINSVMKAYECMIHPTNPDVSDLEIDIPFGEYANPSFESQVETVGKAKTQGIMSTYACIEELYGDTKSEEWKTEEVERLKAEQGVITLEEEPSLGNQ